jgi:carbon storage regulator
MLVLRRKAGEAIVLNGTITIHVLAVEGERVKLGISAPPDVVIVRSELLEDHGSGPGPDGSSPGDDDTSANGAQAHFTDRPASQTMFTLDAAMGGHPNHPNSSGGRIPRRRTPLGSAPTPVRPNSSRYR